MSEQTVNFETIEEKITETLGAEVGYLRTIETYAGQLEDDLGMLTGLTPAAYVVYGGSTHERVDGPTHAETMEFSVIAVAGNLRSRSAVRKEAHGAYDLVRDVTRALTNRTFGLAIERLRPVRTALLFVDGTTAAYEMVFSTSLDVTYDY